MSPEYVRPYVKAQKNDNRDAEGIAEAATRPTMLEGPIGRRADRIDQPTSSHPAGARVYCPSACSNCEGLLRICWRIARPT
jgi:transposase